MEYSVYILQSDQDGSYYIGYTSNLKQRLLYHNSGKSRYTSRKMPWRVVYTETFQSRAEALRREKFLKSQRNKAFYEKLINGDI
jgi:putative endonuclease